MRIRVTRSWYGVAGFVREGEYAADAPELFDLGDYLVNAGHAVYVDEPQPEPEKSADAEKLPAVVVYEDLTKAKLIELAAARGVELGSAKTNAEIIDVLKAAETAAGGESPDEAEVKHE